MTAIALTTFTVLLILLGWVMGLIGLPGTWLIVAAAALHAWAGPRTAAPGLEWISVAVLGGLAVLAEILEGVASAFGVQRVGASRRATVYAVLGSIAGAITGAFVGLPVPLVGPLLAAVLFGGLGAAAGAAWAEWQRGASAERAAVVGRAAFVGRLLGSISKAAIATLMAVGALAALVI